MVEQIVCEYSGDRSYPMALRHDLVSQIPTLKKKYLKYESFKAQAVDDIFTDEQLSNAIRLDAFVLESSLMLNDGKGNFTLLALPLEAQLSPVYAISVQDFDEDGKEDIVLGGNLYRTKPEVGRYDASMGLFLKGNGDGTFDAWPASRSGLRIEGELRDLLTFKVSGKLLLVGARNNNTPVVFNKAAK
jgi:hypothetical protein